MLVGEVAADLPPTTLADVALLTHELVMNGVRHGAPGAEGVELKVERAETQLRVEVVDDGDGFQATSTGNGSEVPGGLGLRLVAEVADHWGITRTDRTRVWFEIALDGHEEQPASEG